MGAKGKSGVGAPSSSRIAALHAASSRRPGGLTLGRLSEVVRPGGVDMEGVGKSKEPPTPMGASRSAGRKGCPPLGDAGRASQDGLAAPPFGASSCSAPPPPP